MRLVHIVLMVLASTLVTHAARPRYEVVGYVFGNNMALDGNTVAAKKMTRINYAFFTIKDGLIVERGPYDAANLSALAALRTSSPQLQILISVGGGGSGSAGFSDMAMSHEGRRRFIESAVLNVKKYGLDGIDIDWEYPGYTHVKTTTVRPEDRQNYTLLLKELRQRLDQEEKRLGRSLVTSSATGATQLWLDHTDMRSASKWLTTVNMMCYDWYNNNDSKTGHDSPLRTVPSDPKRVSIDDSVKENLAAGVPPRKIVIGVPFYGRRWTGVGPTNNGLWQPIEGHGEEIIFSNIEPLVNNTGFVRSWDATAAAPFLYNPETKTFITYNDAEAELARTAYVKSHHLGGIMFWQYTGDLRNTLLDAIDAGFGIVVRP